MLSLTALYSLIQSHNVLPTFLKVKDEDALNLDNTYPACLCYYKGTTGTDMMVERNFTFKFVDIQAKDESDKNTIISEMELESIKMFNKINRDVNLVGTASYTLRPMEQFLSDYTAGVEMDITIYEPLSDALCEAPIVPPCVDPECANGRGISFVRIAGWDITTNGRRINVNDVTLQIADNAQFTGETTLVSIWDTNYDLFCGLYSFETLTQANNYFYADNITSVQKFIFIVALPGGGELATSTFFVELISGHLQPLIMPLQRPTKELTFDIRCTNTTPNNFVLPFDFYFRDGDGTYFVDTYPTTDTGGISILGVDTQENYFDVSELNLNILDLYFNLGIFFVTQGEEFDFYESINRLSVVCRP